MRVFPFGPEKCIHSADWQGQKHMPVSIYKSRSLTFARLHPVVGTSLAGVGDARRGTVLAIRARTELGGLA
jgi:hypothetical protein